MVKAPAGRCLRNGANLRSHLAHCPSSTADLSVPRLFRPRSDLPPGFILCTVQTSAGTFRKAKKGCLAAPATGPGSVPPGFDSPLALVHGIKTRKLVLSKRCLRDHSLWRWSGQQDEAKTDETQGKKSKQKKKRSFYNTYSTKVSTSASASLLIPRFQILNDWSTMTVQRKRQCRKSYTYLT